MGYRIIYVEQSECLRLYLDNLKLETKKGDITIPLSDIQTLIIDNYKSSLSVRLLNALSENNISTIFCGIDHLPKSTLLPINGHYSHSGNLRNQIEWDDSTKKKIHKEMVKTKLNNQCQLLLKYRCSPTAIETLIQYIGEVQDGDVTNREGLGAKVYFRALFGNDFIRFDNTVINAGLNYGYSILRSLISSIIISKGYSPNLGLFHKGKENMFNLSDDIIEVFRPIIDNYVKENLMESLTFESIHREELIKLNTGRIQIDGATQTISNAITIYFESILKCIEEDDVSYFLRPQCKITYDI